MEPVNLEYSTKNTPIAQPKKYLKCLVDKTNLFYDASDGKRITI
jgi:hypothetical protein